MDLGLTGKTAVVTGASKGIGLATARCFLEEGARVAICARHEEALEQAAKELSSLGEVMTFCGDMTRQEDVDVLDEIDAALDEVNVRKYAQYLKNFTDTTQFVLVTHRRSAMEEANVLYGVTMQEDGISKLLKMEQVDFQEDVADVK